MIDRRTLLASGAAWAVLSPALAGKTRAPDLEPVDARVRPGDDFYRYANGPWLDGTVIPPDKGSWDEFARLTDLNAARVRAILDAAATAPASGDERLFGDLYASLLDEKAREAAGMAPVLAELARVDAISDRSGIARELASLTRDAFRDPLSSRYPGPVAALVFPDYRQPTRYLPTLTQGGIGLPDRDDFLSDKPLADARRDAYRSYLRALFAAAGAADPERRAAEAYTLEERIARGHRSFLETLDLAKRYNLWTPAELRSRARGMDWTSFLDGVGFGARRELLVADPDAIAAVAAAVAEESVERWRSYLAAQRLQIFAPFGPRRTADAQFAYAQTALKGVPEPPAAWRRAADVVNQGMGPAVGAVYLRRHFPPAARAAAIAMTGEIRHAMGRRIEALDWMSAPTRERALRKLAAVKVDVGGEVSLLDYSGLRIDRATAAGNMLAVARHEYGTNLRRLERPLDRGTWDMLPQTVNAQSNPILNKIMFPAGIMQPPLFDAAADPAVNYGAIGMFVGHELSHLFDNIGAMFDEGGRMANWWAPADRQHFEQATSALAVQYDTYQPFPDLHVNGRQTLHENVADLAGLTVALDAYRASLRGRPAPVIGGLTGEQRFFLSFAQLWREKAREPALRQMIATGTHSHGEWRVATVRNMDAWYTAFHVGVGDALFLPAERRVRLW